mmetsp:Transcript_11560/g.31615  ORF Transcript_11560/g.31615 Transcript_11560/m.31615 type:complete len:105 (-) Transcript_11560:269-583(-)
MEPYAFHYSGRTWSDHPEHLERKATHGGLRRFHQTAKPSPHVPFAQQRRRICISKLITILHTVKLLKKAVEALFGLSSLTKKTSPLAEQPCKHQPHNQPHRFVM